MANLPIKDLIKAARPVHWIKNLAIFGAIIFTGDLFTPGLLENVILAFVAFNFVASATYITNDIFDAKRDKLHPIKKLRPVASGNLPVPTAIFEATAFALLALLISSAFNPLFFYTVVVYLIIQFVYSLGAKNIPIVDILIIATGFIMRVYAGAFVIDAHLSVWFLLCVISTALFLASGKRRAELNIVQGEGTTTRKSLSHYKKPLLDSYVTMFGNASWLSWALFTFFESPKASLPVWLFLAGFGRTTTINKLLMITIPIVIFGIMRYEALIFEGRSEAPEKVLLSDKALILSIIIWISAVYWIIYSGVSITGI